MKSISAARSPIAIQYTSNVIIDRRKSSVGILYTSKYTLEKMFIKMAVYNKLKTELAALSNLAQVRDGWRSVWPFQCDEEAFAK